MDQDLENLFRKIVARAIGDSLGAVARARRDHNLSTDLRDEECRDEAVRNTVANVLAEIDEHIGAIALQLVGQ